MIDKSSACDVFKTYQAVTVSAVGPLLCGGQQQLKYVEKFTCLYMSWWRWPLSEWYHGTFWDMYSVQSWICGLSSDLVVQLRASWVVNNPIFRTCFTVSLYVPAMCHGYPGFSIAYLRQQTQGHSPRRTGGTGFQYFATWHGWLGAGVVCQRPSCMRTSHPMIRSRFFLHTQHAGVEFVDMRIYNLFRCVHAMIQWWLFMCMRWHAWIYERNHSYIDLFMCACLWTLSCAICACEYATIQA